MNKEDKFIIIEDGYNTSYIDSLLIALFYTPSIISFKLLESEPKNINLIYLQEIIKTNFIELIRKDTTITITSEIINEIRNYSFINGWKLDKPIELLEEHSIIDYFKFISENLDNEINNVNHFLTVNVQEKETNIKNLINSNLNQTNDQTKNNTYILCIYVNRLIQSKIDINKKIKLFNNDQFKWTIHAVICQNNNCIKKQHYYTLFINNNKWYMFDNMSIPSLKQIDMSSLELINKIKTECVFIIYKRYN